MLNISGRIKGGKDLYLRKLSLRNFRNHKDTDIELVPGINIFTGKNGEGKTNILEAIYYLASGRSHLGCRDSELIQWGASCFSIKGEVEKKNNKNVYDVFYTDSGKKSIRINKNDIQKLSELIGQFIVVIFSPESLRIIQGSPQDRRRYLDFAASLSSKMYFHYLHLYHRILTQRNELLKKGNTSDSFKTTLSVWDEQLIDAGSEVIKRRSEYIQILEEVIAPIHKQISGDMEDIKLEYLSSLGNVNNLRKEEVQHLFTDKLQQHREIEKIRGYTMTGPHRDDIKIYINGNDIQKFGSQGQQRTSALSLKLGEVFLLYNETGEKPILLLDDVMSELDDERRTLLLEMINDSHQTIITSTNLNPFKETTEKGTAVFTVRRGKVERNS